MCFHAEKLVTDKYGLAFNPCPPASPYHFNGDRLAVSAGERPRAAAGGLAEHPQSGRGGRGGHPEDALGLEGVEARRPHAHQQPLEEQDGQRHQKAVRQRRGVHNAGAADRPRDRGDRVLAVGQLLVAGPRGPRGDRGLTIGQAPPEPRPAHQRGQHVLHVHVAAVEPRERLAAGGAL
nr:PREDICTED: uncharacterized protein LOC103313949 isoform X1 [Tribolium castaneum]XP_015838283.1 PREDICTED: uncharacterized protein LOC103313949 isoform X1 [Tribolium castaneum]|eukprot:XP_015838282.1 PREDICTED: uncharacterized protein LOC103313949 isoform X1 [Tribolium castaneum]